MEYVENPHMKKLYGDKIRKESGVTKTVKTQLTLPVKKVLEKQQVVSEVNKVLKEVHKVGSDIVQKVERIVADNLKEMDKVIEKTKPRIDDILMETKNVLAETTSRLAGLGTSAHLKSCIIIIFRYLINNRHTLL